MNAQKRQVHGNVYTIIRGKVYGNFHPEFRADKERRASAEGLTFDDYMTRSVRRDLRATLALI